MNSNPDRLSVQPDWCKSLPIQQQSVLMLAARGPDGVSKYHPCKNIVRAYRGTVLIAAYRKRLLEWGETADSFMSLDRFASDFDWSQDLAGWFNTVDELPHHYLMHLVHGAQILGYKHPDSRFRLRWFGFYRDNVNAFHLGMESEREMDERLSDSF